MIDGVTFTGSFKAAIPLGRTLRAMDDVTLEASGAVCKRAGETPLALALPLTFAASANGGALTDLRIRLTEIGDAGLICVSIVRHAAGEPIESATDDLNGGGFIELRPPAGIFSMSEMLAHDTEIDLGRYEYALLFAASAESSFRAVSIEADVLTSVGKAVASA